MFAETSVRILYIKKSFVYKPLLLPKSLPVLLHIYFFRKFFLCGIIKRVKFYIIAVKGTTGLVQES